MALSRLLSSQTVCLKIVMIVNIDYQKYLQYLQNITIRAVSKGGVWVQTPPVGPIMLILTHYFNDNLRLKYL